MWRFCLPVSAVFVEYVKLCGSYCQEKVSIIEFAYLVRSCVELRQGVKF